MVSGILVHKLLSVYDQCSTCGYSVQCLDLVSLTGHLCVYISIHSMTIVN